MIGGQVRLQVTIPDIEFYFSEANELIKNSIVERYNRTLAGFLQKYRVASGSYDWPSYLPDIVFNSNHIYHSTMKATPYDVFHGLDTNKQTHVRLPPTSFKVGDKVRIKIHKNIFSKGDALTYSKDIYVIDEI